MAKQTVPRSSRHLSHQLEEARAAFESGHNLLVKLEREVFDAYFRQPHEKVIEGADEDELIARYRKQRTANEEELRTLFRRFVCHMTPLSGYLADEDLPVISDRVPWIYCGYPLELGLLRPEIQPDNHYILGIPWTTRSMEKMDEVDWNRLSVEPMEENYRVWQERFDRLQQRIEREAASTQVPNQPTDDDEDGPQPGNQFRFGRELHDLSPVLWKLLKAMWGCDRRNMHDVEDEVWDVPPEDSLKSPIRDLNRRLKAIGYPKRISKARRSDFLVWKPL